MKLPCFANSHRKKETSFFCIKLKQLSFIISKKYSIHCNLRKTIDEYSWFLQEGNVEHMNIYMMTQELSNGIGWTRIWWCAPKKFQVHILKCWFWKLLRTVLVSPFHAALLKPHKMGKRGCLSFFLLYISPALDHCTELTVVHPEIKTRLHVYHDRCCIASIKIFSQTYRLHWSQTSDTPCQPENGRLWNFLGLCLACTSSLLRFFRTETNSWNCVKIK